MSVSRTFRPQRARRDKRMLRFHAKESQQEADGAPQSRQPSATFDCELCGTLTESLPCVRCKVVLCDSASNEGTNAHVQCADLHNKLNFEQNMIQAVPRPMPTMRESSQSCVKPPPECPVLVMIGRASLGMFATPSSIWTTMRSSTSAQRKMRRGPSGPESRKAKGVPKALRRAGNQPVRLRCQTSCRIGGRASQRQTRSPTTHGVRY